MVTWILSNLLSSEGNQIIVLMEFFLYYNFTAASFLFHTIKSYCSDEILACFKCFYCCHISFANSIIQVIGSYLCWWDSCLFYAFTAVIILLLHMNPRNLLRWSIDYFLLHFVLCSLICSHFSSSLPLVAFAFQFLLYSYSHLHCLWWHFTWGGTVEMMVLFSAKPLEDKWIIICLAVLWNWINSISSAWEKPKCESNTKCTLSWQMSGFW